VDEIRVNAVSKVRNCDIRHIVHNNREHIIVPSWTLPDNVVMNGGLYPADEIAASFKSLEGTPAPVGHPTVNGKYVLSKEPEAINAHYIGAWNKNVSREGGRVYVEKWIDVEFAKGTEGGKKLLDAIEAGEPIHTSTGLVCKRELAVNQAGYTWIARNMRFDHDAILFGEPGAATPDDGVGMMVNSDELVVNALCPDVVTNGVLSNSYGHKRDALAAAVREVYGTTDHYAYVEDFNDSTVVYGVQGRYFAVTYELADGVPVLGGSPEELVSRVEFIAKGAVVGTEFALHKNSVQLPSDTKPNVEELQPMDPKELADAVTLAVNAALAPMSDQLEALKQANADLSGQLTANAKLTDEANRAVILAKAPGLALAVNSLSGEPLAVMAAEYQDAAPIANGKLKTNSAAGMDEFDSYQGGV